MVSKYGLLTIVTLLICMEIKIWDTGEIMPEIILKLTHIVFLQRSYQNQWWPWLKKQFRLMFRTPRESLRIMLLLRYSITWLIMNCKLLAKICSKMMLIMQENMFWSITKGKHNRSQKWILHKNRMYSKLKLVLSFSSFI